MAGCGAAPGRSGRRLVRRHHAEGQSNFDGYRVLRIADMPAVEVHIVPSRAAPTGVGEPGVAPIGPAVANAAFAASGKRYRALPFSANG